MKEVRLHRYALLSTWVVDYYSVIRVHAENLCSTQRRSCLPGTWKCGWRPCCVHVCAVLAQRMVSPKPWLACNC